jgi:hypothetical protein
MNYVFHYMGPATTRSTKPNSVKVTDDINSRDVYNVQQKQTTIPELVILITVLLHV